MRFSSSYFLAGLASADVVSNINTRFNEGAPSSDLDKAGVSMHQWDNLEALQFDEMWRPYTPEECTPLTNHPKCEYHDRVSSLLINNKVRDPETGSIPLYTEERGGVINAPKYTSIMCAYSEDGGTMDRTNQGCGCSVGSTICEDLGFDNSCALEGSDADYHKCWWGEEDLDKMMNKQDGKYNELVLDPETWLAYLPHSIEAFFYIKNHKQSEVETRDAYVKFQAKYPDACTPLLVLDNNAKESPFFVAEGSTSNEGCPEIEATTTEKPTEDPATTVAPTTTEAPDGDSDAAFGLTAGNAVVIAALTSLAALM